MARRFVALAISALVLALLPSAFAQCSPASYYSDITTFANPIIVRNEAFCASAYQDSNGICTVGIGFNMQQSGALSIFTSSTGLAQSDFDSIEADSEQLSYDNAINLLNYFNNNNIGSLMSIFSNFTNMPLPVQGALTDIIYNLGSGGISEFQEAIASCDAGNFYQCGIDFQQSAWYNQVTSRATLDINIIQNWSSWCGASLSASAAGSLSDPACSGGGSISCTTYCLEGAPSVWSGC